MKQKWEPEGGDGGQKKLKDVEDASLLRQVKMKLIQLGSTMSRYSFNLVPGDTNKLNLNNQLDSPEHEAELFYPDNHLDPWSTV